MSALPGRWLRPSRPVAPRRPAARVLILSRVLHPSFSAELAARLVASLPRDELERVWDETTKLVRQPLPDDARLNVAMLREQLLQRMEQVRPRALERCLRTAQP
jgi:hypothetical protein